MGSIGKAKGQVQEKLQVKRAGKPDESRPFKAHGHAEVHRLGEGSVMRGVFEPGWKWSVDVAPVAGTKTCLAAHLGHVVSGRMVIRMEDGTEAEIGPGDFFDIPSGHDAWVVGDEPCVLVDFAGAENYARPAASQGTSRAAAPDRVSVS